MNIVVGTRNLDEEVLLPVFLANLPFATSIVIADGGSTDRSKEIALADPRVRWYDFTERADGIHSGWRNPEGLHMQFLLDRMHEQCTGKDDWFWLTETDVVPTLALQGVVRETLAEMRARDQQMLHVWMYYVASDIASHYPRAMAGVGYLCFRPGIERVNNLTDPFEGQGSMRFDAQSEVQIHALSKDFGLVHLTYDTEEKTLRKLLFYNDVHGLDVLRMHPDRQFGHREPLPPSVQWYDPRNTDGLAGYGHPRSWVPPVIAKDVLKQLQALELAALDAQRMSAILRSVLPDGSVVKSLEI